ncbi:MAG: c-type cytochrome [Bacteroidota bacterium]
MKNLTVLFALIALFIACGGDSKEAANDAPPPKSMVAEEPAADPKGIGEVKNVELNDPLNAAMVASGKGVYELKCAACHKLSDQRVVGPGWKGITTKRTPEWIMNMTLNVDVMLEEDPTARELLKECLVRMPNQNLSMEDARAVLEFMYDNDAK